MGQIICRQIVSSIDDGAAGPSYSVVALSEALRAHGADCAVMAVGRRRRKPGSDIFAQDMRHVPAARRLFLSGALARAVDDMARNRAVLHTHGLWQMPNLYSAEAARRHCVPLVVAPRGMLGVEALAFSRTRKRLFWALAQRRALEIAHCFHATSAAELEDIRRVGLTAPVAVIPNGIHIPSGDPSPVARVILYLGRLHPKKGIDSLVDAWTKVAPNHPDWRLRIVGPSELGHREQLEEQVKRLQTPRVEFEDPLYGDDKQAAYHQAGLFVLPTLNENFGMVVAEALASCVPTICTKGAPWRGLTTERCGWWVDRGSEPLAAALEAALSLPDSERAAMGMRGRAWMARDFGWEGVADKMAQVYEWLLGRNERPDCVVA